MGNAAISPGSEKKHLVFKSIRAERPAVAENNGLSLAPVVVVNLRAIFCGNGAYKILLGFWLMEVIQLVDKTALLDRCGGHRLSCED